MKTLSKELINLIKEITTTTPHNKLIYNSSETKGKNEFLFFIKPEITLPSANIQLDKILELIVSKIEEFKLTIGSIRIINAAYLEKHNIIAQHYGVINKLSTDIRKNISDEAKEKFEEIFNVKFSSAQVFGSIEFLKVYNHFTPTGLAFLWQNSQTVKLAGGTYAQKLLLDGKTVYLINGFHPRQLEHFIAPDRSIIVMTLTGDTSWKTARNKFIGKTNPEDAEHGSIRNELLVRKSEFGLENISASWNGVHLSAGPVEGLVELIRYNSDFENNLYLNPKDFTFGLKLINAFGVDKTEKILNNPIIDVEGKQISVFDLTEEKDSDECIDILGTL
jgi:hypothetical protein